MFKYAEPLIKIQSVISNFGSERTSVGTYLKAFES